MGAYKTYLDEIPELAEVVFEALSGHLRKPEPIESRRRDGFIPAGSNHGGYESIGFISHHVCYDTNSVRALEAASNAALQANEAALEEYDSLVDAGKKPDQEREEWIDDFCGNWLQDEDQMLSLRFLYHGQTDGIHSATIDVAINWEAPYFRFGLGMSDYREIEIEFKNENDLKTILDRELPELLEFFGNALKEAY